jgi:prephenate dehydrogenase
MPVKLTIIGLGKIGASVGLALAAHTDKLVRTGHDRRPEIAQKAKSRGAVDRIDYNLPASVEGADAVLLALPADQIRATLGFIAQDLREGVVIFDTSPIKTQVAAWVRELLPPGRHYVGLTPAFGPAAVQAEGTGLEAAQADLFQGGLVAVAAPSGTPGEALELATGVVTLLGAKPYFADLAELDGLMATAHLLPQLAAAALVETTTSQPGWGDARKLAGRPYAQASEPILAQDDPATLAAAALANRENTLHALDGLIAALQSLRETLAGEDAAGLQSRLEAARQARAGWWQERSSGEWEKGSQQDLPRPGDLWKRQLGTGLSNLLRPPEKRNRG